MTIGSGGAEGPYEDEDESNRIYNGFSRVMKGQSEGPLFGKGGKIPGPEERRMGNYICMQHGVHCRVWVVTTGILVCPILPISKAG